jgi:hypothetical protein
MLVAWPLVTAVKRVPSSTAEASESTTAEVGAPAPQIVSDVAAWALVANSIVVARVAGAAGLVYGVPHLIYHSAHAHSMKGIDAGATIVGLGLAVVVAIIALAAPVPATTNEN